MFKTIQQATKQWTRRRKLTRMRREFARCGYPLEHLDDSKLEAVVTGGACGIEEIPFSAKTIYFALRRLPLHGKSKHFSPGKKGSVSQTQNA